MGALVLDVAANLDFHRCACPIKFWSEINPMAEYGEWNSKGATLSDVTARKEYGVSRDFIVSGIRKGNLEYREGVIWGNPYLKLLRSQLEKFIEEELGSSRLASQQNETELRNIRKEIAKLTKQLKKLEARKVEIERPIIGQSSNEATACSSSG